MISSGSSWFSQLSPSKISSDGEKSLGVEHTQQSQEEEGRAEEQCLKHDEIFPKEASQLCFYISYYAHCITCSLSKTTCHAYWWYWDSCSSNGAMSVQCLPQLAPCLLLLWGRRFFHSFSCFMSSIYSFYILLLLLWYLSLSQMLSVSLSPGCSSGVYVCFIDCSVMLLLVHIIVRVDCCCAC